MGLYHAAERCALHRLPQEDEALQFLSPDEQECILFFEETIDSLEEALEDGEAQGTNISSGRM